jgi:hypothetical protein
VTIAGGHFSLNAFDAAAIGAGSGSDAGSSVGSINISDGFFSISAANGAGVGGASHLSSIGGITVKGGNFSISAPAAPALGGGAAELSLDGAVEVRCLAHDQPCLRAGRIRAGVAKVHGFTNSSAFFGAPVTGGAGATLRVEIEFAKPSQSSHISGFAPMIHIGDLTLASGRYEFAIFQNTNLSARVSILLNVGEVRGVMLSLPGKGAYTIAFAGGTLCNDGGDVWNVGEGETFFESGIACEQKEKDLTVLFVVGGVLVALAAATVLVVCIAVRARRARAERRRRAEEDGLGMESLAGTDITLYE